LAVHSLLAFQDSQAHEKSEDGLEVNPEIEERLERQQRCCVATMSALIASREMKVEAAAG